MTTKSTQVRNDCKAAAAELTAAVLKVKVAKKATPDAAKDQMNNAFAAQTQAQAEFHGATAELAKMAPIHAQTLADEKAAHLKSFEGTRSLWTAIRHRQTSTSTKRLPRSCTWPTSRQARLPPRRLTTRTPGHRLSADQRMMVKKVLDAVLDTIRDEKNNVVATHDKDMDTLNSEHKAADSKSQGVHDSLIKGLEKEITDTKAVKVNKEALYDGALGEFNEANKQSKAADAAHTDAEEHEAREGSAADGVFDAATRSITTYAKKAREASAEELEDDKKIIKTERDALSEMADAIAAINWSKDAGLLLIQELATPTGGDAHSRTGYVDTKGHTADIRGRIEALLLTVDSQIKAEKTRVKAEFAADSGNNDDERDAKNKAALAAKNGDLAALLKFETDTKATYDSTDKTLDAATKAHHDASIKYQDENDELATAIGIEAKNDGSYNSDFDTTEAQANKLRDQQLEMVENRHRRSQFYLETHVKALNSVDSMLSGVDLRSTQVTAEPPVDAFASREDHDTTLRDAEFSGLHDAATKRVDSYKSNDVSGSFAKIDTDDDAMTNGQGERVNYEYSGKPHQMTETSLLETTSGNGKGTRTIGQYVSELGKAALDEEAKDDSEYAAEKAITGTRSSALLKIADERNRLLKIDDDRTAKEQGQRDVEETLPETKEKPAVSTKDHGEKKTRHEGNVKHQGQTIAKETARRIATKKKSVVMYLEEENIAKTERGVLAEIKNTIVGGQILGDAESSGSAVADHMKDAQGVESMDNRCATCAHGAAHGMCADSEGHHFLRSSGSGTALLQCVDTTRKGEWEEKRGGVRV